MLRIGYSTRDRAAPRTARNVVSKRNADSPPEQRSCSARCSLRKPADRGQGGADLPTEADFDPSPSVARLVEPMIREQDADSCILVLQ